MPKPTSRVLAALGLAALFALAACAAGDPRFTPETPAGFWTGVWHGMISFVTLIIGIFSDVRVYEVDNSGGWYDFGFLLGATAIWGGSCGGAWRVRAKTARAQEWEAIGRKVEAKLRRKIREWAEAEPDEEWNVVQEKAEAKLKLRLREWAERP